MTATQSVAMSGSSEPESDFGEGPQTLFQVFMTGTVIEQCTTPEEITAEKERMVREEAARRQHEAADDETDGEDPPPPPSMTAPTNNARVNTIRTSRVGSGTPAAAVPVTGAHQVRLQMH